MWSSPTPSRLIPSAGRLSLPLYLSLSLCLEFSEAPVGSLTLSTSLCVSLCGAVRRRLGFYGAPVGSLQPAKPTTPTVWSTYRPTDDPTDPPTASNRSDDRPSDQPIDRRPSERPTDRNRLSDTPVSLLFSWADQPVKKQTLSGTRFLADRRCREQVSQPTVRPARQFTFLMG